MEWALYSAGPLRVMTEYLRIGVLETLLLLVKIMEQEKKSHFFNCLQHYSECAHILEGVFIFFK